MIDFEGVTVSWLMVSSTIGVTCKTNEWKDNRALYVLFDSIAAPHVD